MYLKEIGVEVECRLDVSDMGQGPVVRSCKCSTMINLWVSQKVGISAIAV